MKLQLFLVRSGLFAVCMAYCTAALPEQIDDLFEAVVPVVDREPANREAGIRDAMSVVLIKLTGQKAITENPATAGLLGRSRRFLQRYTYEDRELPPDPADIFGQPVKQPMLHAWFDADGLQRALRAAGLPLWGRERPTTLLWLAFEAGGKRLLFSNAKERNLAAFLVGDGEQHPVEAISQSLADASTRRGLPLRLPRLDDADRAQLGFADVWGGFSDRILAASEPYATYAVVAGNIFDAGEGRWSARWVLYHEGGETEWQVLADSLAAAVDAGVDGVAEIYGRKLAVDPGISGPTRISIEIRQINSLARYAGVISYLENLSMVQAVNVERVSGDKLLLELRVIGTRADLEQAIAIGNTLMPVKTTEVVIDLDNPEDLQVDTTLRYLLVN